MEDWSIRAITLADSDWVQRFVAAHWGDTMVVVHGQVYYPHSLPGFMAQVGGECVGLLTYTITGEQCEIVTLDSLRAGQGIGSALIGAVAAQARRVGCTRLWLITTNDNLHALGFYQRRNFHLVALYPGAIEWARAIKPAIPFVGANGIPLRDEIELAMQLRP